MAVALGTNSGFVSSAPSGDPTGTAVPMDAVARATKDTSPSGSYAVTSFGWYCQNATEESTWVGAIYSHDAVDDEPNVVLASTGDIAKGTDAGWKTADLAYSLDSSTTYWIGNQLDDTSTQTNIDQTNVGGTRSARKVNQTSLPDPWGTSTSVAEAVNAQYALYGAASSDTTINLSTGSLRLTGRTLTQKIEVILGPGVLNLTGQAVTTSAIKDLVVGPGTLRLTGQPVGQSTKVVVLAGSLQLTGQVVGISQTTTDTVLSILNGKVNLTGETVDPRVLEIVLGIQSGKINLTGRTVETSIVSRGKSAASRLYVLDSYVHTDWTVSQQRVKRIEERTESADDITEELQAIIAEDKKELKTLASRVKALEKKLAVVKKDNTKFDVQLQLASIERKQRELQDEMAMLTFQLQLMEEDEIIIMALV